MNDQVVNYIAGFFKRIGALCIDIAILSMIGFILGFFLESTFVEMGTWGRLVGFSIALIYFGLMNSKLFGGQTAGKTLLNIKVVDSSNNTIALPKSLIRAFILTAPFFLNGVQFSVQLMQFYAIYFFTFIAFGGFTSILYLYIFNKNTRQSLHDLISGTFVVNNNTEQQGLNKVSKIHFIVVTALFIAAAILPVWTSQLAKSQPFKDLLTMHTALSQSPLTTHVTVESGSTSTHSMTSEPHTITYLHAQIFLSKNVVSDSTLAREKALIMMKNFSDATKKDMIQLTLIYGYDTGLWSQWISNSYSFKASELEVYTRPKIE